MHKDQSLHPDHANMAVNMVIWLVIRRSDLPMLLRRSSLYAMMECTASRPATASRATRASWCAATCSGAVTTSRPLGHLKVCICRLPAQRPSTCNLTADPVRRYSHARVPMCPAHHQRAQPARTGCNSRAGHAHSMCTCIWGCYSMSSLSVADTGDKPWETALPPDALQDMKQAKGTVHKMADQPWWCAPCAIRQPLPGMHV